MIRSDPITKQTVAVDLTLDLRMVDLGIVQMVRSTFPGHDVLNPYRIWHSSTLEAIKLRRDMVSLGTLDPHFLQVQQMFHNPDNNAKKSLRKSYACMREIFWFVGPAAF